jgi:formylmethanofuran--tetrahydromethanopterin N-formyltransferase
MGKSLRFFGDGWQLSKKLGTSRYWRVPVMHGEFVCQDYAGVQKSVGGGNFLVLARSAAEGLVACERAIRAMSRIRNVIMPFPGGVVGSGSKVGSKYKFLPASTNQRFCPTLKGAVDNDLTGEVGSVLEIVIDGLTPEAISEATRVGIEACCRLGSRKGIIAISAGNYGGKLGPFHFHLRELMK